MKKSRRKAWNSTLNAPEKRMARGKALKTNKPMPKRNAGRTAKRRESGEVYGEYHAWVSALDCALKHKDGHRCSGRVAGHHLLSVGAGGKDAGNEVPLCATAHTRSPLSVHTLGAQTFERHWHINLQALADRLFDLYLQERRMVA